LFPDFYKHRHPHFSFSLSAQKPWSTDDRLVTTSYM
jgi:hypothetical protein